MRALLKLTVMELKLYIREPIAAFFTVVFPLMMLLLFGSIYGNSPAFAGFGTVDVSVPALISMIIGIVGINTVSGFIASYKESGILRRYRITPLRPYAIAGALIIVYFIVTTIGAVLLVICAKIIYKLRFTGNIWNVLICYTLASFSFYSIGFMIAGLSSTSRIAQVVSTIIFYPMFFLSGTTFPQEIMPESLRNASLVMPLTHVVRLLKGMWFGEPLRNHIPEIIILIVLLVAGTAIASKTFRWDKEK